MTPLRARIVKRPEEYRWNSFGYHLQTGNKDNFLPTNFGLKEFNSRSGGSFRDVLSETVVGSHLTAIFFKKDFFFKMVNGISVSKNTARPRSGLIISQY